MWGLGAVVLSNEGSARAVGQSGKVCRGDKELWGGKSAKVMGSLGSGYKGGVMRNPQRASARVVGSSERWMGPANGTSQVEFAEVIRGLGTTDRGGGAQ